ncbi:MAG TPA: formate dehydrogenase accessory sulfurtransferase FdhD [Pseudomonadales bacterium]|nr:formate dehydrogenase accessory sulfurtransferase FdhD [Pseudomonadales bacterium]
MKDDMGLALNDLELHGLQRISGVATVPSIEMSGPDVVFTDTSGHVIEEDALTIDIADIGTYTLMWTPTGSTLGAAGYTRSDGVMGEAGDAERLALAAGFAFTEGIIESLHDVLSMAVCADTPGVVRMTLADPTRVVTRRRNVLLTSSCGICGSRDIVENNAYGLVPVPDHMRFGATRLAPLMAGMREHQQVFSLTGGVHAAAIFNQGGQILAVAEDLGRHNALDKVIGRVLLEGGSFERCGVLLSSRLSLEMVAKAIRAGFEMIAAIGAPTSLAIEIAQHFGITLCGFVRNDRATLYTHPHRICNIVPAV